MIFRSRSSAAGQKRLRRPLVIAAVITSVVATTISLAPLGAPSALAADSAAPPTAQQLAAIRKQAAAVQADLTAGAKRLEAAKAQLKQLESRATASKAAADKLDGQVSDLRRKIARFASDVYEHPVPDIMTRVLSDDDIVKTLQAKRLLEFAQAGRTQVLREASAAGLRAKALRTQADQDVKAAAGVRKSIEAQVAQLQDKAAKAAKKLEAAQAAYDAEQARLEAERQAKAKAAREAAARAAAARAAAARARAVAPSCPASASRYPFGPWGGYSNGLIPSSRLCRIIGGGSLRPDAAIAFNKMSQAYARAFGHPLCVNASYRPYSRQVSLFRSTPSLAAVPGTSNHGWGLAVDLGCGVQTSGSAQYRWMINHAGAYGWVHPSWAFHNPFEPWHWEYGHL